MPSKAEPSFPQGSDLATLMTPDGFRAGRTQLMTRPEMAALIGMRYDQLSRIENGRYIADDQPTVPRHLAMILQAMLRHGYRPE